MRLRIPAGSKPHHRRQRDAYGDDNGDLVGHAFCLLRSHSSPIAATQIAISILAMLSEPHFRSIVRAMAQAPAMPPRIKLT